MKLYLSSIGIPNSQELVDLIGKPTKEIRALVIINALDIKTPERRGQLLALAEANFKLAKINFHWLDFKDYFGKENKLQELISNCNLVWSLGGNTFYLRYMLKKLGFDRILAKSVKEGLVYGGDSAGALIAGSTLKYLDLVDETSHVPEVIYDGLKFIDFGPLPHWGREKYQAKLEITKTNLEKEGYSVRTISDGQVFVINGQEVRIAEGNLAFKIATKFT